MSTGCDQLRHIDAENICIIKPTALGDVVQALPILPVLKERFRNAKISWVIAAHLSSLLEDHPQIDQLMRYDRKGGWSTQLKLLRDLRANKFDFVLDLQGLLRSALMTAATGARFRVGLETAREGAHLACNITLSDTSRHVPAHLRYFRVADALGMGDLQQQTHLAIGKPAQKWVQSRWQQLDGPPLVINPGARWATKRVPVEKLTAVAAKAVRRYGFATVIVGSRDEVGLANQAEQLLKRFVPSRKPLNLAGQTNLKQLAALLQSAECVITNDSGPMHLAAGLGTPVVGVFTCTSAVRSGPPGKQHELVSTQVHCRASYRKRCPYSGPQHHACMEEISIDRIWYAFVKLIEKNRILQEAA